MLPSVSQLSACLHCRFLPPCFPEHLTVKLEDDVGGMGEKPFRKESTRRLDLTAWMAAWDRLLIVYAVFSSALQHLLDFRYSLAAAILDQLPYSKAMLHKSIVLEVSCLAPSEGRSAYLGVLYDEIVRKHWEDMCGKVHTFDVQLHAGILQEDILRRARALHDTLFGHGSSTGATRTAATPRVQRNEPKPLNLKRAFESGKENDKNSNKKCFK